MGCVLSWGANVRERICKVCNGFHAVEAWPSACFGHWSFGKRSDLAAPQIIKDCIEPIRSMADGRMYDSRSKYLRSVRAAGCDVVGNDTLPAFQPEEPKGVEEDVKRAIEEVRSAA